MRKRQKKITSVSDLYTVCDKDTRALKREAIQFFGLRKINFQTFLVN